MFSGGGFWSGLGWLILSGFYGGGGWLAWVVLSALEEGLSESVLVVLPEPVWEFPELGLFVLPESVPLKPELGLVVLPESVPLKPELGLVVLPESVPEPVFYKPPSDVLVAEFVSFELELLLVFVRSGDSYSSGFWLKSKSIGTQVVISLQTVSLSELLAGCVPLVVFKD